MIGVMEKRPSVGGLDGGQDNIAIIPYTTHQVIFNIDVTRPLRDGSSYQMLGCVAYRADTGRLQFFPKKGDYDECQIDKSGRWLVIKENVDNQYNEDNRVIDLQTGAETVLYDQNGAAGHSDVGYGYIVGEDDKASQAYAVRVWQFRPGMTSGEGKLVYHMPSWNGPGLGHVAHVALDPRPARDARIRRLDG